MFTVRKGKIIAAASAAAALLLTFVLTRTGPAKPAPRPQPPVNEANREAIKPGNYATTINIHNPSPTAQVNIWVKAVVDGEQPSAYHKDVLAPDYAQAIDCDTIESVLYDGTSNFTTFEKGYVVLFVSQARSALAAPVLQPLDVVGVYTAEPPGSVFSNTGVIPGISEKLLTILPRYELVPATTVGNSGLPAGRYLEYAAKFLCGEVRLITP